MGNNSQGNIFSQYDNFIFDLYGTLIDVKTDEQCARTWKKWLKWLDKNGVKHPDYITFRKDFFAKDKEYREIAKKNGPYTVPEIDIMEVYDELFKAYGNKDISNELMLDISYAFREASREYYRLFPNVEKFLKEIKNHGKNAYILSNAQASYTEPEIKNFHLDEMVDDYLMSSDYKCMKPDKAFFDELINRYDMDRERTVMIGDSKSSDIEGARLSGINHIHLINENEPNIFYGSYLE